MCNICKLEKLLYEVLDTMRYEDCDSAAAHFVLNLFWQFSFLFDCDRECFVDCYKRIHDEFFEVIH